MPVKKRPVKKRISNGRTADIDREDLLQKLQLVQAGLTQDKRATIEQSSCFVFTGQEIVTFNDRISCKVMFDAPFKGAVQSGPLLALLGKLPDERIGFRLKNGELELSGNDWEMGISMEAEIGLPIDEVEDPSHWQDLPEEFGDAVDLVHECCSNDGSLHTLTCVNVTKEGLDATDNYRMAHYDVEVPVKNPFLVKKEAIRHVTNLNMTHISLSKNWAHFKNQEGLILSARRMASDGSFPNIRPSMEKTTGEKTSLPKGLMEVIGNAEICTQDSTEEPVLKVELIRGLIRITGTGNLAWYRQKKHIEYKGPKMEFLIPPKLLLQIVKQNRECLVSEKRLKVESDRYVFVTCLMQSKKGK